MTPSFFYAALLYLLFVTYGSLVPLDFRPIPFDLALNRFKNIQYLNLGIASRADWVANILLYIPLAFLGSATFDSLRQPLLRLLALFGVVCFCLAVAVSIEFTQLFFPPRTVSLNDLIAETIGTGIGVILWHSFGRYLLEQYRHISLGSFFSVKAAIIFYLLAYVSLSFFPYDFVTSATEFESKLNADSDHYFMNFDSCRENTLRCGVKFSAEILVLLPLGILLGYLPYVTHRVILNLLAGFFLGVFIEGVQLFLVSGSAQGISILTRMTGLTGGAVFYGWLSQQSFKNWARLFRPLVLFSIVPYMTLVWAINGGFNSAWLSAGQALTKLQDTHFLPLYYFYYTSESVALVSLLSNIGTYLPIGLMFWLLSLNSQNAHKTRTLAVGLTAAVFATLIEIGKLFLAGKHADPTDILIAFVAAAGTYLFLNRLMHWRIGAKRVHFEGIENPQTSIINSGNLGIASPSIQNLSPVMTPRYEIRETGRWIALALLAIIIRALYQYPVDAILLALFLVLYGALLLRFPFSWLIVVPALLPVMNFAPWTGRFFFDEFDLVILTTLAFYFFKKTKQSLKPAFSAVAFFLLACFTLIYAISLFKGLLPLETIDANAFTNYYSHYNSLRVAKGYIEGLLLLPLLIQTFQCHARARFYFAYGMIIGLGATALVAVWERFLFPGMFDYTTDYRITSLFSGMHTGGGHIDAYLVMSLPFISLLFIEKTYKPGRLLLACLIFTAGLYTLMVTFSRGPYFGFILELMVLIMGLLVSFRKHINTYWRKIIYLPLFLMIIVAIALPILQGSYMQSRFDRIDKDVGIRTAHWQDAYRMMTSDFSTALFGMGLGAYPKTYFWNNSENITPATYSLNREQSFSYLRLGSGDALYMEQRIDVRPDTKYLLKITARGHVGQAILSVPVCEKALLYRFRCVWQSFDLSQNPGQWQTLEQDIDTKTVGSGIYKSLGQWPTRPVKLSLYNGGRLTLIDIKKISLIGPEGSELIRNGDFSENLDHWFFSTDSHLPWHIKNIWVALLFEQGWLGIVGFSLLLIYALLHQVKLLIKQEGYAAILLSSMTGFFVVGMIDSPFDEPRLTLLFFMILFIASFKTVKTKF